MRVYILLIIAFLSDALPLTGQHSGHEGSRNSERVIRYQPDGSDFVIVNGERRFNRALYAANTGFRVEAGDLPEFALYLPGMGGNFKFGLITDEGTKWLTEAKTIKARYRPGGMHYEISDPLLGNGSLILQVIASYERDGALIKVVFKDVKSQLSLAWTFGGVTGKRFSRDGDIGADPASSFDLKPEYCHDNDITVHQNTFKLAFGFDKATNAKRLLHGTFPPKSKLRVADANQQNSPTTLLQSKPSSAPVLAGEIMVTSGKELYFNVNSAPGPAVVRYDDLPDEFIQAEKVRSAIASRVTVITPDPYINTLGAALSIAADAIWEDPTYLHGAVAWRMRLNAWRGASVADPLGWHDRARTHFSSYIKSQLTSPNAGPLTPDTALHFARHTEKLGNAIFSSGYICRNPNGDFRAHHYDMNLVFFDQLLSHFQWTGDISYIKEMWPSLKRHLDWEKRNFDSDNDNLYDAYCCIWASDALQYSNGGVTHSSAYNYRINKIAAQLADLLNEDSTPYSEEAVKIHQAMQRKLWIPSQGFYAEYKDFLGDELQHTSPGLWTIYHAIDSNVPDNFQEYQCLRYVDTQIPHIPLRVKELRNENYHLLSTTNWQPYTWSINNVALAEMLHTSLAYWQGNRPEHAFTLWKSALLESMYLGSSPGNFQQLSSFDAMRGELYRDFADPIGMAARSLVEGLFGIRPDALNDTLRIVPGFPATWDNASLSTPDITFHFERSGDTDQYIIEPSLPEQMNLALELPVRKSMVKSILLNGKKVAWRNVQGCVGNPRLKIKTGKASRYKLKIEWSGDAIAQPVYTAQQIEQGEFIAQGGAIKLTDVNDPQQVLENIRIQDNKLLATVRDGEGSRTIFAKVRQGDFEWWSPMDIEITKPVMIIPDYENEDGMRFDVMSYVGAVKGKVKLTTFPDDKPVFNITTERNTFHLKSDKFPPGTNIVTCELENGEVFQGKVISWNATTDHREWTMVDLTNYFNDRVTNIFKNRYLSPRPESPTLQLPWQGIGNWCYPLIEPSIDDTGIRKLAAPNNLIQIPQGISFAIPATAEKNIVFTSRWDNYPDSVVIPLNGNASRAYLLMTGSTNPMQSRFVNGMVTVQYKDNTTDILELKNPENWWPIEQDYYIDGMAFRTDAPKPVRMHLKTGLVTRDFKDYSTIKGFSNYAIDGGAATVLDLPLDKSKELRSITVKSIANDVVIGLMSVTLMR